MPASDLADWLEEHSDAVGDRIDDFILALIGEGKAKPVLAFAWWAETLPIRVQHAGVKGLFDVLRFGCDLDFESPLGVVKGVAINLLRAASVIVPSGGSATNSARIGMRQVGMLAAETIEPIKHIAGPCQYQAINLILSHLKGAPVRLFATVEDIISTGGKIDGISTRDLLKLKRITDTLKAMKISFREIPGLNEIDDVMRHAQRSEGPVHFVIQWADDNLKMHYHAMVAVKNKAGQVRLIEYFGGKSGSGAGGFASWDEFVRIRSAGGSPNWRNVGAARLEDGNPVIQYASEHLRVLEMVDGALQLGVPLAMGIRFGVGPFVTQLDKIVAAFKDFISRREGDNAPDLPDLGTNPTEVTKEIFAPEKPPFWYTVSAGIPERDWPSSRAGRHYQDVLLWPLILEATQLEEKKTTGKIQWRDQNKLFPGQQIFVPDISGLSRQKITAARIRGKDWKRVGP